VIGLLDQPRFSGVFFGASRVLGSRGCGFVAFLE
jgi:hypothetical protein